MTDESERNAPIPGRYQGPANAAPYALSRLSGPVSLVDVAHEIHQADQQIAGVVTGKLEVIAEQIRALRMQAERILTEARENALLHRVDARFKRIPGKIYHLYVRPDDTRYWSMLSPEDWGSGAPHTYLGSYRLEADQSFTPVSRIPARDAARAELLNTVSQKLLGGDGS